MDGKLEVGPPTLYGREETALKTWLAPAAALALLSCGQDHQADTDLFARAEAAVKRDLKDPYSPKFTELYRCGHSRYVTGQINAKNSYGGYTGDKSFVFDGEGAWISEEGGNRHYIDALNECSSEIERGRREPAGSGR